jgi:DNA-binding NtrC family response regulator
MKTVLIIEDEFIAGYELGYLLKAAGYTVEFTAMPSTAMQLFRRLNRTGELAAVVCDNRLLGDRPAASALYAAIRAQAPEMPFVVYSGYPPKDLPKDDPRLRIVHKPFANEVVALVARFAPVRAKGRAFRRAAHRRDAA